MGKWNTLCFACFAFVAASQSVGFSHFQHERLQSPSESAQDMIRRLNLFPEKEVNMVWEKDTIRGEKNLVERRFRFPGLRYQNGDDPVAELGHRAGYYKIKNSHAAKMFYFFFESRSNKKDPLVIWLTGGPGCGSEIALFYENGPFTITDNMTLEWNQYGWDRVSNILYVDQPVGTGFSYTSDPRDIRHNEKGVSDDLYDFLQAFLEDHQDFIDNDLYIAGESYAGHYIPAFASRIHSGNKAKRGIHVNLKGFAIGNGLTDPAIQYEAYVDFALENSLIDQTAYNRIKKVVPICQLSIKLCGTDGTISCMASYVVCNAIFTSIMSHVGDMNYYDIRKKCVGNLCYDFSNVDKFLNMESVKDALGVGSKDFVSCSPVVYEAMLMDWMRNLEVGIPELLEAGIEALIYAGEYDLICNWLGNSRWVNAMEWSGQKNFTESPEAAFMVDGSEAGVLRRYGPLSFLKVHDAGHMVPMDQPVASLEMLRRWLRGELSEASESEPLVAVM